MIAQDAKEKPVPCDIEAEAMLLGAMLADEALAVGLKAALRPEHFLRPEHATVARAIFDLADKGQPCLAAVRNELAAGGKLASVGRDKTEQGGADYLEELRNEWGILGRANSDYYLKAVRGAATLRAMLSISQRMQEDAKTTAIHNAEDALTRYQHELFNLDLRADMAGAAVSAGQAVADAVEHADGVAAGTVSPGLMTGFGPIDRATGGLQPGDLWTLAAATSAGKTAFALAIAAGVAKAAGSVLYVSAEMDRRAIANRLLQSLAMIPGGRLRTGNLDEHEHQARQGAVSEIRSWRFSILDASATVGEIAVRARQLAVQQRARLSLIVADYLQLLTPSSGDTRAQQIGGIAWGLKRLAMETGTPVLMLSQLNREGVKGGTPPSLYSLKESGDVENHSNAVILLHRPEPPQWDTDGALIVWARIAKARDGCTTPWPTDGQGIRLRFRPELTRFEPLTL